MQAVQQENYCIFVSVDSLNMLYSKTDGEELINDNNNKSLC